MTYFDSLTFKNQRALLCILFGASICTALLTLKAVAFNDPFILPAALMFVAFTVGVALLMGYRKADLERRMAASDGPVWDVELNDVTVGTISDAEYAAIQRQCLAQPRLVWAQVVNIVAAFVKVFGYCLRVVPLGLFWGGAAMAIHSPELVATILVELPNATSEMVHLAGSATASVLIIMPFCVSGMLWLTGKGAHLGITNLFDDEIAEALRRHCQTPIKGRIVLMADTNTHSYDLAV